MKKWNEDILIILNFGLLQKQKGHLQRHRALREYNEFPYTSRCQWWEERVLWSVVPEGLNGLFPSQHFGLAFNLISKLFTPKYCKRHTGQDQACSKINHAENGLMHRKMSVDWSQSENLFQTRLDRERGIVGPASLLHSWHWVLWIISPTFHPWDRCHQGRQPEWIFRLHLKARRKQHSSVINTV